MNNLNKSCHSERREESASLSRTVHLARDLRSHLALDRWTDKMIAWVDEHLPASRRIADRQMVEF